MDRLTQAISRQRSMSRRVARRYVKYIYGGGGVSPSPIPGDKRVEINGPDRRRISRYSHLESCRHAPAARCASHFIHPPPVFGQRSSCCRGRRMARATRYLYNKPGDNVRVRGTTPPREDPSWSWSRKASETEREKEKERESARELFSFYIPDRREIADFVTWHIGGCENLIALDRTTWIRLSVSPGGRLFAPSFVYALTWVLILTRSLTLRSLYRYS